MYTIYLLGVGGDKLVGRMDKDVLIKWLSEQPERMSISVHGGKLSGECYVGELLEYFRDKASRGE